MCLATLARSAWAAALTRASRCRAADAASCSVRPGLSAAVWNDLVGGALWNDLGEANDLVRLLESLVVLLGLEYEKEFLRRASGAHPFMMSVNSSKLRRVEDGHNEPCRSFPGTESLWPMYPPMYSYARVLGARRAEHLDVGS